MQAFLDPEEERSGGRRANIVALGVSLALCGFGRAS